MTKIRAFVAVNLNVAATRAVADLAEAVKQETRALALRVAWVPPPNLHVTLKFLGWTSDEAIEGIRDRLTLEMADRSPFEVRARGLGAFPDARHPRVIWVGLEDAGGQLGGLAQLVEQALSDLGFIKDERPWRAHMTIGRVKDGRASLEETIAKHADRDLGLSTIRELLVYESKLRAQGAEYLVRARVPLAAQKKEEAQDAR